MQATLAAPRAVLCDLDDTLYPERTYVESGIAAAARFLSPHLECGEGQIERAAMELLEESRGQLFDRLLRHFEAYAPSLACATVHVYRTHRPVLSACSDVLPALQRLRGAGCRLALVSDGKATVQRAKFMALGLESLFDAVVFTDDLPGDAAKPSRLGFEVALTHLGIAAGKAVYLADDVSKDFLGPRALGMRSAQVTRDLPYPLAVRGKGSEHQAADIVVADLAEAADWLLGTG